MQEKLLQRFLRYVAVPSQSNAANANVPSSEGQRKLAELLKQDLAELGLVDLEISEYSVLTGKLPAYLPEGCTKEVPAVGVDTAEDLEKVRSILTALFDFSH
jgi:tripeptide aminopeptidase